MFFFIIKVGIGKETNKKERKSYEKTWYLPNNQSFYGL